MVIIGVKDTGNNFDYKWPGGDIEQYPNWITYHVRSDSGLHEVMLGFTKRKAYKEERERVVVFIDGYPTVEFFSADDFPYSGEVLAELKVHGQVGEPICRYPGEAVPDRYSIFTLVGLPNRVAAKGIHNAWAVVANISDHKSMVALAFLRNEERAR